MLIGPDGMLGRAWAGLLADRAIDFVGITYPEFDFGRPGAVDDLELGGIDTIVNCAAWTDVDGAEADEATAALVNADGVGALARRAAVANATVVHYSTDYVFSGDAVAPVPIDAPIAPINAYGRTKALGEQAVVGAGEEHLVVRTSWLYAPWGHNFVRTMARLGKERPSLRVVDDQRGRPTSCEHLASTTLALLELGERGMVHVTDGGECTWFELARHVMGKLHPACVVEPCTSEEFVRPARRPAYSVLALDRVEALLGPMPHWTANVDAVLERLEP
jgi:dTDP-4-dehydrorhamnose reductase